MSESIHIPFDQYSRYRDLKILADLHCGQTCVDSPSFSLLDVGGYFLSLNGDSYCPVNLFFQQGRIMTVDMTDGYPEHDVYCQADAHQLPFHDDSFDWINAADVIEHVPPAKRQTFVSELLRCSRNFVTISTPVDSAEVNLSEELVVSFIRRVMKIEHQALLEHRQHGLLSESDLRTLLESLDTSLQLAVIPSGNLYRWIFMMITRHLYLAMAPNEGINLEIDRLYNSFLYTSDHTPPTYRNIYLISKHEALTDSENKFLNVINPQSTANPSDIFLLDLLSRIEDQERWRKYLEMQDKVENMAVELQKKSDYVEKLEKELIDLCASWPVRTWHWIKSIGRR